MSKGRKRMTALEKANAKYGRAEHELKSLLRVAFPVGTIVQSKTLSFGNDKLRARIIGLSPLYPQCLQVEGGTLKGHVSWWSIEKVCENAE